MMLPKIEHPSFPILVPSLDCAVRFRPFTVKEEKILLMSKESSEAADHLRAIHQVVTNCVADENFNQDVFATFDLEWLFLKLRRESVGPTITQSFIDNEEREKGMKTEPYQFTIILDDVVAPRVPEDFRHHHTINLDTESKDSVMLRYPPAKLFTEAEFIKNTDDAILYHSTIQIMSGAGVYRYPDFTQEEVIAYYDTWVAKDMERVKSFLNSSPTMSYEIDYKNKLGNDRKLKLTSVSDFFTF